MFQPPPSRRRLMRSLRCGCMPPASWLVRPIESRGGAAIRTCCECIHLCTCSPFHSKNMPTFIFLVHCGSAANDDDLPSGTNVSTRALIRMEKTVVFDMCTEATIEQWSNVEFIYYYHSIQPFGGIVPATKILSVGSLRVEESCVNPKIV